MNFHRIVDMSLMVMMTYVIYDLDRSLVIALRTLTELVTFLFEKKMTSHRQYFCEMFPNCLKYKSYPWKILAWFFIWYGILQGTNRPLFIHPYLTYGTMIHFHGHVFFT